MNLIAVVISIIASLFIAVFVYFNYKAFEPEEEPEDYRIQTFEKVAVRGIALHVATYFLLLTVFTTDEEIISTIVMILLTFFAYVTLFLIVPAKIRIDCKKREQEKFRISMEARSDQRTELMEIIVEKLKEPYDKELNDAIFSFYLFIEADILLGPIIEKHGAGFEAIRNIIISLNNYTKWEKQWHNYQFIPVSSVAFEETLERALYLYESKVPTAFAWNEMRNMM